MVVAGLYLKISTPYYLKIIFIFQKVVMSNLLLLVLAVVLLFTSLFFGLSYVRERRKMKMRFNKFRR
ncbi:small membrane protein [Klebsiella pneumoniae]|nr:small membrane protein [Klebsiella pneumoniae]MEA4594922.1 small membrane protein [Klebsiella pneumoniae]